MIITCPSCATRYAIKPASLGADGRMVRCTSCGHRWFVGHEAAGPVDPAAAASAAAGPPPADDAGARVTDPPPLDRAPDLPPAAERTPIAVGRSTGATVGWLAVLLILLILTGLVLGRNEVVALAPQTAPIYQRMGLPVTQEIGLELRGVVSERLTDASGSALRIAGDVHNVAGAERTVPPVRIALLDAARAEIAVHLVEVPQAVLADGAMTRFELRIETPPAEARNFSVTFAVAE